MKSAINEEMINLLWNEAHLQDFIQRLE